MFPSHSRCTFVHMPLHLLIFSPLCRLKSKIQTSFTSFFGLYAKISENHSCLTWRKQSRMQISAMKYAGFPVRILCYIQRRITIIILHIFLSLTPFMRFSFASCCIFLYFIRILYILCT